MDKEENLMEEGEVIIPDEVEEVKDQVALLREELEAEKARVEEANRKYLRALADADNQRKRWLKEREELTRYASLPLLRKLLPVLDDIKRAGAAIEQGGDVASLLKGIQLIEKRLNELLEQEGARPVSAAVGEVFDPQVHEALTVEITKDNPDGTILEEFQTGYLLGERLIRPGLVRVGRNKEDD